MADDKMIEFAEAEVRRLQAELEKTPAFKRLKAAQDLIATYKGNPERVTNAQDASPAPAPGWATPAPAPSWSSGAVDPWAPKEPSPDKVPELVNMAKQHLTKTAQVEAIAAEYLAQKGRRATSGEVLPIIQAKGIHVPGKQPNKTVSAYLSTSKRFDNVPAYGGYGLVEWNGRRTAPQQSDDAPAPANPNGLFN